MSQTHIEPERGASYSTPRWVKVLGITALILIVLAGIFLLASGEHGPGRHMPSASVTQSSDAVGHTSPMQHGASQ